jgi:CrcB protein
VPPPRHHPLRRELAVIFAGGCVGALLRAALGEAIGGDPAMWPWATLTANLLGAFALGWINTVLTADDIGRPLLGTGICGALTTFSTLQLELLRMLERGDGGEAAAYLGVSVVAGLAAVTVATSLARSRSQEP